jgi:hypothetical protein
MRLREHVPELQNYVCEKGVLTVDKINLTLKEIMKSLEGSYRGSYTYDILAGISASHSVLSYFYQDGRPEDVKKYKVIGVWHCWIFLSKNWRPEMDMETLAKLGYFILGPRRRNGPRKALSTDKIPP